MRTKLKPEDYEITIVKICKKHGPLTEDLVGYNNRCKECVHEADKRHREKHKTKIKISQENYRKNNKQKLKKLFVNYYQKNREKLIERSKSYIKNNRDRCNETNKNYQKKQRKYARIVRYVEKNHKPLFKKIINLYNESSNK